LLLDRGANVLAETKVCLFESAGCLPRHGPFYQMHSHALRMAAVRGHADVLALLLDRGATICDSVGCPFVHSGRELTRPPGWLVGAA